MSELDIPVLDLARALEAMDNDRELYGEILSLYLDSTASLLDEMETQSQTEDMVSLKRSAHTLKSSSRTVGALRLGSRSEHLEKNTPSLSAEETAGAISRLRSEFGQLCAALFSEGFPIPVRH